MKKLIFFCMGLIMTMSAGCTSAPSYKPGTKSVVPTIFIVRHGEAYKNLPQPQNTPQEKLDSLTPLGRKQAKKAGVYLTDKNIAAVVTSPTGRTRETAHIIAETVGLDGFFDENPDFVSMRKGRTPEGKPITWAWREEQWKAGRDPRPLNGESLADATNRAVQAVEDLIRRYPGKGVVIVTHGDICAGLAGEAEKTPFHQRYSKHGVKVGSVIQIGIGPKGDWKLAK